MYFENLLPNDLYAALLASLPEPAAYDTAAERHYPKGEVGGFVRSLDALYLAGVARLPAAGQAPWRGLAAALTAPELKAAVFAKLSKDLAFRYGVPTAQTPDLAGFARPTLYRETDGFEIPPHPDTRKKVVTMHLYLPADESQQDLGTALYHKLVGQPLFGGWRKRLEKVLQFRFAPNSGYAFVADNTLSERSWHEREQPPPRAGVRNTLLNTFYEEPRGGFGSYLKVPAPDPPLSAADGLPATSAA